MKTITLTQLLSIITEAYAVAVNDTLYFIGYDDEDKAYVADNDGYDKIELSEADGNIEVTETGYFFYVKGEAIELKLLKTYMPIK